VNTYDESSSTVTSTAEFRIHYPLRELFTSEIQTFISFTHPLKELVSLDDSRSSSSSAVVSHKDVSIDEIMTRYFESAEESFSNVVANVVRTTGKLERMAASEATCGLCGVSLDEQGDSRWAGELGDEESPEHQRDGARLCYGCKRSVNG
jgi:cytoplasmic tRNA 2-thiolation protein 2